MSPILAFIMGLPFGVVVGMATKMVIITTEIERKDAKLKRKYGSNVELLDKWRD
ncbi:hypothetical protein HWB07_gp026 [Bacillus phage vB_BsuM-Goe3]|uniref:Uncharacterized protein n=1 Tax=Bacillus phage vB_BsuM-Goe3 TaxID=1933063 RepID=A0A217EQZ5_BPGO3|nr:hypothetical protein HWB07_gp026 [Bacillus phage vB_BsuM-Goe3]APZ82492.1 hypothetical protein Goe3_c02600 [Bacillus phage vB_BsuM-Goe3]